MLQTSKWQKGQQEKKLVLEVNVAGTDWSALSPVPVAEMGAALAGSSVEVANVLVGFAICATSLE